jgi:hypothetical protein
MLIWLNWIVAVLNSCFCGYESLGLRISVRRRSHEYKSFCRTLWLKGNENGCSEFFRRCWDPRNTSLWNSNQSCTKCVIFVPIWGKDLSQNDRRQFPMRRSCDKLVLRGWSGNQPHCLSLSQKNSPDVAKIATDTKQITRSPFCHSSHAFSRCHVFFVAPFYPTFILNLF